VLGLSDGKDETSAETFIVVSQVGAQIFGIMVDRVFDTEEIVVKPVAPILMLQPTRDTVVERSAFALRLACYAVARSQAAFACWSCRARNGSSAKLKRAAWLRCSRMLVPNGANRAARCVSA